MPTSPIPVTSFTQEARARIRDAIYLLGYLIHAVDWRSGEGHFTYNRIAEDTGFPVPTVRRWMDELRKAGEVSTTRTPVGLRVTILNYGEIAATRKVKHVAKLRPGIKSDHTIRPNVSGPGIISDHTMGSDSSDCDIRFGLCNIEQILSQNHGTKSLQSNSPLNVDEGKAPARGLRNENAPKRLAWEDGYEDSELIEAARMLSGLGDEERETLRKQTLQQMEVSAKRFLRVLVQRNEHGELEPAGPMGEKALLREMGRVLKPVV